MYPNGPYGQGFPGQQPGYPQVPGYGGYPPYGAPAPAASGGTAITAGILALLGGLTNGCWSGVGLLGLAADNSTSTHSGHAVTGMAMAFGAVVALLGLILLIGSILLLMGKAAGRWMVVIVCILLLLAGLASLALGSATMAHTGVLDSSDRGAAVGFGIGAAIGAILPPLITLVLAAVPSTGRWIAAKRGSAAPQAMMPPPYYPG